MSAGDDVDLRCAFSLVCDQRWEQLDETGDADRRHCGRCDRDVHRIDAGGLAEARAKGLCIALESAPDPAVPIHGPPIMTLGMVSGPPVGGGMPRAWLLGRSRVGAIALGALVVAAVIAALWWWI